MQPVRKLELLALDLKTAHAWLASWVEYLELTS